MPTIKITEPARSDLEEIWLYVAGNNQSAANNLIGELRVKIELLANTPNIGRLREDLMLNLRSLPHKKYVIFYFLIDDGIEIFRILHGSRDITQEFDDMLPSDITN